MDVSKELIRSIVEKVLAESAGTAAPAEPYKEKDPSESSRSPLIKSRLSVLSRMGYI